MKKLIIALLTLTAIYFIFILCSCHVTVNNDKQEVRVDTVFVTKLVPDNKLEKKVKKLKKTLRFRTYQRDSLQCKFDSLAYSVIKKEEQDVFPLKPIRMPIGGKFRFIEDTIKIKTEVNNY